MEVKTETGKHPTQLYPSPNTSVLYPWKTSRLVKHWRAFLHAILEGQGSERPKLTT
jgi:hypothetical protein